MRFRTLRFALALLPLLAAPALATVYSPLSNVNVNGNSCAKVFTSAPGIKAVTLDCDSATQNIGVFAVIGDSTATSSKGLLLYCSAKPASATVPQQLRLTAANDIYACNLDSNAISVWLLKEQ